MRRVAPWLPLAFALATFMVSMIRAMAMQGPPEWVERAIGWGLLYGCFFAYIAPYVVPMLLLALAAKVRRRSGAPPAVGRIALLLALPGLALAIYCLLDLARLFAFDPSASLTLALTVNHQVWCIAIWIASTMTTGLWVLVVACRWLWWPRPATVVGAGPYR